MKEKGDEGEGMIERKREYGERYISTKERKKNNEKFRVNYTKGTAKNV